MASGGCRCTLSPHGGTSLRFNDRDSNREGFSISRCPDVIYFAAGQPGIWSENGQHVLQKALFLESVWIRCSIFVCVCVCVSAGAQLVNEVIK